MANHIGKGNTAGGVQEVQGMCDGRGENSVLLS